jgi:hypothetical protein
MTENLLVDDTGPKERFDEAIADAQDSLRDYAKGLGIYFKDYKEGLSVLEEILDLLPPYPWAPRLF